ncbi:hypothetical protein JHK82_040077 [Glycine max]|nr:hypothetical protein JHK82_040077 [Glycine max]KAG5122149.1 hypothetical protein JHK84_040489 [Glycine max]
MIKDHIAPFAITFSFHHGDSTSGAMRISLVVTKEELKRMLRDRNENDSQQTSLELLPSNMVLRDKRSIGVQDFEVLKVVGQGAFGKVYRVRRAGTSQIYAMKVM